MKKITVYADFDFLAVAFILLLLCRCLVWMMVPAAAQAMAIWTSLISSFRDVLMFRPNLFVNHLEMDKWVRGRSSDPLLC